MPFEDTSPSVCVRIISRFMRHVRVMRQGRSFCAKKNDVALLGSRGFEQGGLLLLKTIKEMKLLTEVILMTPAESASLFTSIQAMKLGAFDDLHIMWSFPSDFSFFSVLPRTQSGRC